ncbi:unnamed protein product [Timema podura]|uniref:Uncharacterized protein n=1 Tax=Timema podura TaxID=61482 RepID=A0ABN7P2W9_TIMPD|nr:unnamed protein product [Timema podura]
MVCNEVDWIELAQDSDEVCPHLRGGRLENHFGGEKISTSNLDSNLQLRVIGSLVYCESSALDHVATEADYYYYYYYVFCQVTLDHQCAVSSASFSSQNNISQVSSTGSHTNLSRLSINFLSIDRLIVSAPLYFMFACNLYRAESMYDWSNGDRVGENISQVQL